MGIRLVLFNFSKNLAECTGSCDTRLPVEMAHVCVLQVPARDIFFFFFFIKCEAPARDMFVRIVTSSMMDVPIKSLEWPKKDCNTIEYGFFCN